ncbi:AI-2E family transporter [Haloplanus rallus]|jgi:predicted PurR-regulated permease PerM|uniref:AI-2E family transporter n=1 Tax=Haloplanus rallus TaxID=1816183 RepID=A0A6B9FG14_9EURY|nr:MULTISPECIES: AI-2E family transporter [Haloplanus]QGX94933.1 AI-2E family transporter [Haloplanus rallus]
MDERRAIVALFGLLVTAVIAYMAYRFVAALTVAVFIYYSTRRFYRALGRLRLPKRVRAVTVILLLALPLLLLLSYTLVLLVTETRRFVDTYPVIETAAANVAWLEGLEDLPSLSFESVVEAYRAGRFDAIIDFLVENAALLTSAITGFFLNLFIVIVVSYYLLIDGSKFYGWLERFDDDAIVREFLEAADRELEAILFGNLLNVIAIALIGVGAFKGYNALAPAAVQVPYPALAGVLTGVASLIPVVGMKIVYVPITAAMSIPLVLDSEYSLLVYVAAFLAVAVVVVDTIPDLVLRPYLSGERTHVGLLMLAYIFGPVIFGFYGLFFAPVVLALGVTFAHTALPRLLGGDDAVDATLPPDQRRLDEF